MMYVETNKVIEILRFRVKSLNAIGMYEAGAMISFDIKEIISFEKSIDCPVKRKHHFLDEE